MAGAEHAMTDLLQTRLPVRVPNGPVRIHGVERQSEHCDFNLQSSPVVEEQDS